MTDHDRQQLVAEGLATVSEAAGFLAVSRSTLYLLMDSGQLPHCKIGRARRIPWRAVHQFAQGVLCVESTVTA